MESKILNAIKDRYYDINTLKLEMYVDSDSVLMNLMSDLNHKYTEEQILNFIKSK